MSNTVPDTSFILVGRILGPWGSEGALKIESLTDNPHRFEIGETLFLQGQPFCVEWSQQSKGASLLKLRGIESPEEARLLLGLYLEVPEERVPPAGEDEYYHYQILGLQVYTKHREFLGEISHIFSTPSNDVYLVQGQGKELLLPAIDDVITEIDLEQGRITIDPIPGLLD